MILDKENIFCTAQALTGSALSVDIIDLGQGDIGPAEAVSLFVTSAEGLTGATGLTVELQTSDKLGVSGTALDSAVTLARFVVPADKAASPGKLVAARLPHGMKRYARLNFTPSGTVSAGTVTAGLVIDTQS